MDADKVLALARDAGGFEYGPHTFNMSFQGDNLYKFAALLQQQMIADEL